MKLRSILLLSLASLVLVALELMTGSVAISIKNIWLNRAGQANPNDPAYTILWDSRVPRTLAAILAGSALAWSGMLMQTLFRNPLAGPSMLGISSGAALGVAVLVLGSGGMLQLGSMPGYLSIA
ncbi:MAG: iron chelate uptake ABC transporter family permease subunit, partial [Flavobacteriales bacterium]